MSDSPRTDATDLATPIDFDPVIRDARMASLARQLERELAAMTADRDHFFKLSGKYLDELSARSASTAPSHAQRMVDAQAKDGGLWFDANLAPEALLQKALRALHAAVEADTAQRTESAAHFVASGPLHVVCQCDKCKAQRAEGGEK